MASIAFRTTAIEKIHNKELAKRRMSDMLEIVVALDNSVFKIWIVPLSIRKVSTRKQENTMFTGLLEVIQTQHGQTLAWTIGFLG